MWVILSVVIFMVVADEHRDNVKMDSGIVFIRKGEFVLSANYWNIVVDINFDSYLTDIDHILLVIQGAYSLTVPDTYNHSALGQELTAMREETLAIRTELQNLIHMLTLQRTKRALIDVGGELFKILFGVATGNDISLINSKLVKLGSIEKGILHLVEDQATILNETMQQVMINKKINTILARSYLDLNKSLTKQVNRYNTLWYLDIITSSLRHDFQNLKNAVESISQGKLTPQILSENTFLNVLISIRERLPENIVMIATPNWETLYNFYRWTQVTAIAMPDNLRLFLKIPLVTPHHRFELYQLNSVPVEIPSLNVFTYFYSSAQFFAISKDRQYYLTLSESDWNACARGQDYRICSPDSAIYKTTILSCEYALFVGHKPMIYQLCEQRIVRKPRITFFRNDLMGHWIYSVPEEMLLTINCPPTLYSPQGESRLIKLKGTGVLTLESACVGIGKDVFLSPHFQGRSVTVATIKNSLRIPEVSILFNSSAISNVLNSSYRANVTLLDTLLSDSRHLPLGEAGNSIRELRQKAEEMSSSVEEVLSEDNFHPTLSITALVISCIVIGALCCVCGIFQAKGMLVQRARRRPPVKYEANSEKVHLALEAGDSNTVEEETTPSRVGPRVVDPPFELA